MRDVSRSTLLRASDVTFSTELTIEDHKDFTRICGPRPGQRAVFVVLVLFLLVASVAVLYSVILFAISLAELWQQGHLDALLNDTGLLLSVAAGLLLLPVVYLFIRTVIRLLIQTPAIFMTDSIDMSQLRDGLNTGQVRFEVVSDGLRITMSLEEEQFAWSAFQGVRESDHTLALMFDDRSGVIVPKRAFGDDRAFERFKSLAEWEIGSA